MSQSFVSGKANNMKKTEIKLNQFITDIYIDSYLNKAYKPLENCEGFIKNNSEIVIFKPEAINKYLDKFDIIKLYDLSLDAINQIKVLFGLHNRKKVRHVILEFKTDYFHYTGSKFKKLKKAMRKYESLITDIVDSPRSCADLDLFIQNWKQNRKKAHHIMTTGVDKNFVNTQLAKHGDRLISKFFYIGEHLVGYSIIEIVAEGIYNNLFCKIDTNFSQLNLFIDSYMFELVFKATSAGFIMNMGSDNGKKSLLKYKTTTFPTLVHIFERFEARILNHPNIKIKGS